MKVKNYKILGLVGLFAATNVLINAYFICVGKKPWGRHPYEDRVNHVAKIEAYFLLTIGLVMLAFPDRSMVVYLNNSNESYRSLFRSCGALVLSLAFESYCMSEYIYLKDKKQFMLSRLSVNFSTMSLI